MKHTRRADQVVLPAPSAAASEHPNRRSSDVDGTAFRDDTAATSRPGVDPGLLVGATDDEILRSYLDLVRMWRRAKPQTTMRLRRADVAVLVSILGTDDAEIERRLIAATSCTPKAARKGRLLLIASVGALSLQLTGVTIAGALTPMHRSTSYAPALQVAATATDAAIATAASSSVNTTPTAPTVRTTAAPTPPAPTAATSIDADAPTDAPTSNSRWADPARDGRRADHDHVLVPDGHQGDCLDSQRRDPCPSSTAARRSSTRVWRRTTSPRAGSRPSPRAPPALTGWPHTTSVMAGRSPTFPTSPSERRSASRPRAGPSSTP